MVNIQNREFYHGDNLAVMRGIDSKSFDLIATDPPFGGKSREGSRLKQGMAGRGATWHDRWKWDADAELDLGDIGNGQLTGLIDIARGAKGHQMAAFLTRMTTRAIEMHRLLKDDGVLLWHCDPEASHYLKVMLDVVFGSDAFRNEVVWHRTLSRMASRQLPRVHDVILFFAKGLGVDLEPAIRRCQVLSLAGDGLTTWGIGKAVTLTAPNTTKGESSRPWRGIDPSTRGNGRHWNTPTQGQMCKFIQERGAHTGMA